jgi:hypothetical protein
MATIEEYEQLEGLDREIQDSDAAVRNAEVAISDYLALHPNMHAMQQVASGGWVFRLNAMTADLHLTSLETTRDVARERFYSALRKRAELKGKLNPEEVHIAGHRVP